jgi:hypothetical protein
LVSAPDRSDLLKASQHTLANFYHHLGASRVLRAAKTDQRFWRRSSNNPDLDSHIQVKVMQPVCVVRSSSPPPARPKTNNTPSSSQLLAMAAQRSDLRAHPLQARTAREWTSTRLPLRSPFYTRFHPSNVHSPHQSSLRHHHTHSPEIPSPRLSHTLPSPLVSPAQRCRTSLRMKRPPMFTTPFSVSFKEDLQDPQSVQVKRNELRNQ